MDIKRLQKVAGESGLLQHYENQLQGMGSIQFDSNPAELVNYSLNTGAQSNPHLDELAYMYSVDMTEFIANIVAPPTSLGINTMKGTYSHFDPRTMYDRPSTLVGPASPPGQINLASSDEQYQLGQRSLAINITMDQAPEIIAKYGSMERYKALVVGVLTHLLMLDHELNTAALYQTAANYDPAFTSTASPLWNDETSIPRADVTTACAGLYRPCDTLIMGNNVYNTLKENPNVTGSMLVASININNAQPAVNMSGLANYFGENESGQPLRIVVGNARYNTTSQKVQATATLGRIWSDYVIPCHLADNGGLRATPFIRTLILNDSAIPNHKGFRVVERSISVNALDAFQLIVSYFAQEIIYAKYNGYLLKVL